MKRHLALLLIAAAAPPAAATGAEKIAPRNGQVIPVKLAFGMIDTPDHITFSIRVARNETNPAVWVARGSRFTRTGLPIGHSGGWFCSAGDFAQIRPTIYSCTIATFPWLGTGRWWWTLSYDGPDGRRHATAPSSFSLRRTT